MTLGIALVLIFVLYLIDKNKVWRQAVKAVISLAILGVLVISGLFGWRKVSEWREAKTAQEHKKLVDACVTRYSTSGYANSGPWARYVDVKTTCENDPNKQWIADEPKDDADARHPNVLRLCTEFDEKGRCVTPGADEWNLSLSDCNKDGCFARSGKIVVGYIPYKEFAKTR